MRSLVCIELRFCCTVISVTERAAGLPVSVQPKRRSVTSKSPFQCFTENFMQSNSALHHSREDTDSDTDTTKSQASDTQVHQFPG